MILIDADVLGRERTGDETYVTNLLRELPAAAPDLRFAAVTRRPDSFPTGVEPLHAAGAPPGDADGRLAPRGCSAASGPSSPTSSTRCRSGCHGRSVVTLHDLSFEDDDTAMGRSTG